MNQPSVFQIPKLSEYADAISRVMRGLKDIGASPSQIISLMKGEPEPQECPEPEEMILGIELDIDLPVMAPPAKTGRQLFTARQIARKLGVYSIYGRPHAHAVSAILNNNLFIDGEHYEERVLFETENILVFYTLYDEYAFGQVRDWLMSNGLPSDVDGYYYTYHISYKN